MSSSSQNSLVAINDLYDGSVYEIITTHGSKAADQTFIVPSIPDKKINGAIKGATNNAIDQRLLLHQRITSWSY